jgi:predicted nucleic acid-binding protein
VAPNWGDGPWVVDTSAWARASDPAVAPQWEAAASAGDLLGYPIVTLELLYDAPDRERVAVVATAIAGLNDPETRRARRFVRRGEPAEDVVVARYAVAAARERQRRFARSSFAFGLALGAALGLSGIGLAVYFYSCAAGARAMTSAALGALMLASSWRTWLAARNLKAAEQAYREHLRRSGAPYVPGGPHTPADLPPLTLACSLAIHVAAIFIVGGVVTLLLRSRASASPGELVAALTTRKRILWPSSGGREPRLAL